MIVRDNKLYIGLVWYSFCSDLWGRRGEVCWGEIWSLVGVFWWFYVGFVVVVVVLEVLFCRNFVLGRI